MEKICIACSAGGHLTEVLQLKKAWCKKEHFLITDNRAKLENYTKTHKTYFVECPRRDPLKFLTNFKETYKILRKEKPTIIISTGADTALAALILGKTMGAKIVFIESFCRITSPSLTGKLVYPFADEFFVQWKENLVFYPKAKYYGRVF